LAWDEALEEMKRSVHVTVAYIPILAFLFKYEGLVVGIIMNLSWACSPSLLARLATHSGKVETASKRGALRQTDPLRDERVHP
jgi:hypothetical protein